MGFNIFADFDDLLDQAVWILSGNQPSMAVRKRLRQAYFEVYLMFISDNPFLITFSKKRPVEIGEITRGVYFCEPKDFRFGQYTLTNTPFWDRCFDGKGFVDALVSAQGLFGESSVELLTQWSDNYGLHCFNIYER